MPPLNAVFHALGDATRRQMLRELADGERTVGQLAEPFDMSLAAASKHIKALESAGLIRREVRGRTHLCRLDPGPLASANEWLGTTSASGPTASTRSNGCSARRTAHHRTQKRRRPMSEIATWTPTACSPSLPP